MTLPMRPEEPAPRPRVDARQLWAGGAATAIVGVTSWATRPPAPDEDYVSRHPPTRTPGEQRDPWR